MIIYLLVFLITAVVAFSQLGKKEKVSPLFFSVYILTIGLFVGLGDMLGGYDRYIYCEVYTSLSDKVYAGQGVFNDTFIRFFAKEPVYGLVNVVIGMLTPNRYVFILLYTLLLYTVYGICFYRFTSQPFFVLLFFLGMMFFFTFTYLRQVMAVGVVWLSWTYYIERKLWKFLIIVMIAVLIHNSAFIMVVLFFVPLKKWRMSHIMLLMIVLLTLGIVGIGEAFAKIAGLTQNENLLAHVESMENTLRYEYILEAFLFLYLLGANYKSIEPNKRTLAYLNLYLAFCGILLLFCKSSDGGRLSWYGMIGVAILLTRFCEGRRNLQQRIVLLLMFFVLYFRILYSWQFNLCPYKTFLTPGHTGAEWIYEQYEYDQYYDIDKFYNLVRE